MVYRLVFDPVRSDKESSVLQGRIVVFSVSEIFMQKETRFTEKNY